MLTWYENTAIIAKEPADLRNLPENDKRKSKWSRRQMIPRNGLSIQEARDLIQQRNELESAVKAIPGDSALITSSTPRRAPPTCSGCYIKGRIRTNCPTRRNS